MVDGRHVPVYFGHGLRYVEAIKGKKYSIRLRNPLGVRVARGAFGGRIEHD